MLPEIALESLRYFGRLALDGLQMHSRYLRDLINCHARTLPLRYIHGISIVYGRVRIQLVEGEDDETKQLAPTDPDLEIFFHYVNHAFIRRLSTNFLHENVLFPCYLAANVNDLQCYIKALHIEDIAGEMDYTLVDFLGVHMKPQVYETSIRHELSEDYVTLFRHKALRSTVKHVEFELSDAAAPGCIIPALFVVDVVEACAITTEADPRPWIAKFIEKFEMAERGMDIVRSVTLIHERVDEEPPMRNTVDPLGQPQKTGVPTPHSDFLEEWSRREHFGGVTNTHSMAELFVFENVKSVKKLDVFKWTIDQRFEGIHTTLYDAYLLHVIYL